MHTLRVPLRSVSSACLACATATDGVHLTVSVENHNSRRMYILCSSCLLLDTRPAWELGLLDGVSSSLGINTILHIRSEMTNQALDGPCSCIAQSTDGMPLDLLGHLPDHVDLF